MRILALIVVCTVLACKPDGSDGSACGSIVVTGDQSVAGCSAEGDVGIEQDIDESTGIEGLEQDCIDLCIERGNAPQNITKGDCFKECVDEALMGAPGETPSLE